MNSQSNKYNGIQIVTTGNEYTPGFSNGKHFDANDLHGKGFHSLVIPILEELLRLKEACIIDDEEFVKAVKHLFRLGTIDDSGELKYSMLSDSVNNFSKVSGMTRLGQWDLRKFLL